MDTESYNDGISSNNNEFGYSKSIGELFLETANSYSDRIAIRDGNKLITYGKLSELVLKVYTYLDTKGVRNGDRIIVGPTTVIESIAAILGILLKGCTYVPLNSEMGLSRLKRIVSDVDAKLTICDESSLSVFRNISFANETVSLFQVIEGTNPFAGTVREVDVNSVASVLYTSGSTGVPKGVIQSQRNILHHISYLTKRFGISFTDKHTLIPSLIFDASTTDIYCTLLNGAELVNIDPMRIQSDSLAQEFSSGSPTIVHCTPTFLRKLFSSNFDDECLDSVRLVIVGGETLYASDYRKFKEIFSKSLLINGYGATETTGFVAMHEVENPEDGILPVGSAVPGFELSIRNEGSSEGEIIVRSKYISLGYLNEEKKNNDRFIHDPNGSVRTYKTGDTGVVDSDSVLKITGRNDRQIKIRGYRVNLEEIEKDLLTFTEISNVAVVYSENTHNISIHILPSSIEFTVEQLESKIYSQLPNYLGPLFISIVSDFPETSTGKIDRKKIKNSESNPLSKHEINEDIERELLRIWESVFSSSKIDLEEGFFEAGADSISLAKYYLKLRECLNVEFPQYKLYQYSTIRRLSSFISKGEGTNISGDYVCRSELRRRNRDKNKIRAQVNKI
ncbi:non-ribosomal peptide synthetase [Reinekea sp. G2M2-21]|uniref:non-ribosomal peptide synthetase n=1 Tax=Reinekea sp. G2M2-21 TaxID=2788942 RepID=UPI0018AA7DF6|nr:non-ribosomal peptide synthetase [Reinekea sp. G2M2-21]